MFHLFLLGLLLVAFLIPGLIVGSLIAGLPVEHSEDHHG